MNQAGGDAGVSIDQRKTALRARVREHDASVRPVVRLDAAAALDVPALRPGDHYARGIAPMPSVWVPGGHLMEESYCLGFCSR